MSSYTAILFDLDGTLTEPKQGITRSFQYALKKFGINENNMEVLVSFIGPPLKSTFREYYGFDENKAWEAVTYYREYFAEKGIFENEVYPGVAEMLKQLKGQKKKIVLATSKATIFSEQILEHFKLSPYFDHIVGSNYDGTRADKAEVIKHAMTLLGGNFSGRTVMVGDRKHDILGAKLNGIDSIGVTYGYGAAEELEQAGAGFIFASVSELTEFLLD